MSKKQRAANTVTELKNQLQKAREECGRRCIQVVELRSIRDAATDLVLSLQGQLRNTPEFKALESALGDDYREILVDEDFRDQELLQQMQGEGSQESKRKPPF